MTADEAQELRAKFARLREINYGITTGQRDGVGAFKEYENCLASIEAAVLPAPPEPRWPEGMAEWEMKRAISGGRALFRGDDWAVSFSPICSPTQAARIACWVLFAEELEGAIADVERARKGECDLSDVLTRIERVYNKFRAAEAGEDEAQ